MTTYGKFDLLPKKCIIYCRVSTGNQANNLKGISMDSQEHQCRRFMAQNNLTYMQTFKETTSAFRGQRKELEKLIGRHRNCTMLVYDASRFSRNLAIAKTLLNKALSRNIKIIFVNEELVWDREEDERVLQAIMAAQKESEAMSRRIRDAIAEKKRQGYFVGGVPPYGYQVKRLPEGRKLEENPEEQAVINFIKYCLNSHVKKEATLNRMMREISDVWTPRAPIRCYDKNGDHITYMTDCMTSREVSDLLNDYLVEKRGTIWTTNKVTSVMNRNNNCDDLANNMERLVVENDEQEIAPLRRLDNDKRKRNNRPVPTNMNRRAARTNKSQKSECTPMDIDTEDSEDQPSVRFEFQPINTGGFHVEYDVPETFELNNQHQWLNVPNPFWIGFENQLDNKSNDNL